MYVIANDTSNNSDVRTLFCFKPGTGTDYSLDKINMADPIGVESGNPPQMVCEGDIQTNASFSSTTINLKKANAITTANGIVSGKNADGQTVSFKVDHILWITNDPNSPTIAYGVALVEEQ